MFDFCEHFHLPSILSSIPFICKIGIKLNSGPSYNDLMKDFELQYTKAASYMKATGFLKDKKEVLKKKEEALEDENKGSEDEDTTLKDLAKSVGDIEVCYFYKFYLENMCVYTYTHRWRTKRNLFHLLKIHCMMRPWPHGIPHYHYPRMMQYRQL